MKYTIIGFPRIGEKRELKKNTELYWKNEINKDEYLKRVNEQLVKQLDVESSYNLSSIPVLDFSLYDIVLDTIFTIGAIPQRYLDLNLNDLDTYFALGRGYQNVNGDVKALTMKKWFNTNYHYLVPEIDDATSFKLNTKYLNERLTDINIKNKRPTIIGPFTFLKLAKYKGNKNINDFVFEIINVYKEYLKELANVSDEWIQIDEPYLVKDLTNDDINLFNTIYNDLLKSKSNKILLQTYFGDVRDNYNNLINLPFDGIGLDFIEGYETLDLIKNNGFPKDKILFAGVVNGKNIWKCNYKKTIELINEIKKYADNIILSTSCSLLHVPYTIKNEKKLNVDVLKSLSFAYEKLNELKELAYLVDIDYENNDLYKNNQEVFKSLSHNRDKNVVNRVSSLKESDFKRSINRKERQEIQRKILNQGLLPTTTIGSFPQTSEVKQNRNQYKKGLISFDEYNNNIKKYIKDCIELQERIGLDVLVHGEFERNDMVEYFGENLDGFIFTENGWVQSYGTRGVKPPVVYGDIKRNKAFTVDYIKYANSITKKDVKGMLTGPVTILNWSFPREDISIKESMYQIALALQDEVLDLETAGIRIIQIDEAALREKLPLRKCDWYSKYLDFAIPAFRLTNSKVKPETQIHTHMCYSEFEDIITAIDNMDADAITFEASRSEYTILNCIKESNFETEVGPGVYDIHSPRVPSVNEIKGIIKKMLNYIDIKNLWINPDCGLKTRGNKETTESLINLVEATKEIKKELNI